MPVYSVNNYCSYFVGGRIGRLRETADPEHFGGFQERAQVPLVDVNFTVVNELYQRLQIVEHDVLQHDYRVFARSALRKLNKQYAPA